MLSGLRVVVEEWGGLVVDDAVSSTAGAVVVVVECIHQELCLPDVTGMSEQKVLLEIQLRYLGRCLRRLSRLSQQSRKMPASSFSGVGSTSKRSLESARP